MHPQGPDLSPRLRAVVADGLAAAGSALSEMAGLPIGIASSVVELVPLENVPTVAGRPDLPAVAVYLGIQGAGHGHILLLLEEHMARRLAGLLLGEEPDSVDVSDELPCSALAEVGNVCCSAFLNSLGDAADMRLEATPPSVMLDMQGAIMDACAADIALEGDEALVIGTHLAPVVSAVASRVESRLVVIPSPSTLTDLLERLGRLS